MENNRIISLKIRAGRRLRSESGGTLVETAISMSLFFLLIFGILEGSLAAYSYHYISHAARQGARYAIVRGSDWSANCTDYTDAGCIATSDQISQYIDSLGFPGIDASKIQVTVQCATVTTTATTATLGSFGTYGSTCNAATDLVQVTVSYPFSVPIAGVNGSCGGTSPSFCMSSTSQMSIAN